jgi:hypothetical protein
MTRLQKVAIHEAGHAVVAVALGLRVELVHVRRAIACDGVCVLDPSGPGPTPEDEAATLVAGDVAVELARAGWPAPNASAGTWYWHQLEDGPADRERRAAAADPSPEFGSSDAEKLNHVRVSVRKAWLRASEILGAHWPGVRAIADALIQAGELEGDRVHAIAAARGVAPRKRKAPAKAPAAAAAPRAAERTAPPPWRVVRPLTARQLGRQLKMSRAAVQQMGPRLPRVGDWYHPRAAEFYRLEILGRGFMG